MSIYYKEINHMMDILLIKYQEYDKKGFVFEKNGLNFKMKDIIVVKLLGEFKELTINEIIEKTSLDRNILDGIISTLKKGKIIEKEKSNADARKTVIKLTDKGETSYKGIISGTDAIVNFALENVTVNEEKAVLKFLSKINQLTVEKYTEE